MQYAILIFETDAEVKNRSHPETTKEYWAAYNAYARALVEAKVAAGGAGLQPPHTATTVRLQGGKRTIQDGPFADTKEQVAGFFLIDVPDLDKALEWAAKCPAATWSGVEVRPVLPAPTVS